MKLEIGKEFVEAVMKCEMSIKCVQKDNWGFDVEYIDYELKATKMVSGVKRENLCLETRGNFTSFLIKN